MILLQYYNFAAKLNANSFMQAASTKFGDGALGRNQSPYAWSKGSNTELAINYIQWFGLSYTITYFYSVYGTRAIATGKHATLLALLIQTSNR